MENMKFDMSGGMITIETEVIAKIAGIIATGCYGVVGMAYRSKTDSIASLLKKDNITKGIGVKVNENNGCSIDIHIIIQYGVNINAICDNIIKNVKYHVNYMTELDVEEVNVYVEGFRVQEWGVKFD